MEVAAPAPIWSTGGGQILPLRIETAEHRTVAVIGPSGAPDEALRRWAGRGVPDDAAWSWPGSYVVVAVDPRTVTIWTDLASAVPLYWTRTGSRIAWCTSSRFLAGLSGSEVDVGWLATRLITPGHAGLGGRSAFADVRLLPPGSRIVLSGGRTPSVERIWEAETHSGGGSAPTRRFGEALRRAVEFRVRDAARPSTDLSGGKDSSCLAALAAAALAPHGRAVQAVTLRPAGVRRGGDLDFVPAVAALPGVEHHWTDLTSPDLPYTGLGADILPGLDEPAPGTIGARFFTRHLRRARALGSDLHMTGDGGDSLLSLPIAYLADLVRERRLVRLLRDCHGWAQLYSTSPARLLRAALNAAPATTATAATATAAAIRSVPEGWAFSWYPQTARPSWATPRAVDLAAEHWHRWAATGPAALTATETWWRDLHDVGRTAAADVHLADELCAVSLHNPYLDSAVVHAAAAVLRPTTSPWQYKTALTTGLPGLLPEPVASRRTKGDATADHIHGLRAALPALLDLADGRLAAAGLVDPDALRAALKLAAAGIPFWADRIEPVCAAEAWLASIGDPIHWTVATAAKRGPRR